MCRLYRKVFFIAWVAESMIAFSQWENLPEMGKTFVFLKMLDIFRRFLQQIEDNHLV
jgi:hypothetical protein